MSAIAGSSSIPGKQTFEVLLFASLREVAGEKTQVLLPPGATVTSLLQELRVEMPALAQWLPYVRVAVNCEYADADRELLPGDEIALLPPVSGGAGPQDAVSGPGKVDSENVAVDAGGPRESGRNPEPAVAPRSGHVRTLVTADVLDVPGLIEAVAEASGGGAGAVVPFIGIVRDNARGHQVTHLEYQAYGAMAQAELEKIGAEAVRRWHCVCACAHRTGSLGIGEASLVVVVATAHRADAFEACRWIVDEIKVRVPVWKKEFTTTGTFWIEDPFEQARPGE